MSPKREGDGSRLPRILEDPNPNGGARRHFVKEEMPSPDVAVPSRPSDGEGGHGFRCESAPNFDAYIDLIRFSSDSNSFFERAHPSEALPVRVIPS